MEDVIAMWNRDFKPVQQEVESINFIARGKAVHQPMALGDDPANRKTSTGLNVRNNINRRTSAQGTTTPGSMTSNSEPRVLRIPSHGNMPTPTMEPTPSPEPPAYSNPLTPSTSNGDYFQRGAAGKKKPPPPPPKRIGSQSTILYAVALYAFDGQSQGDLSFKEGDQIQVVKKLSLIHI